MGKKRILLVDDEPKMLQITKKNLESEKYELVATNDPGEVLEKAAEIKPDLVVADLYMPMIEDGISLCQRLGADARTKNIPLVFFANAKLSEVDSRCEIAGAWGVVMKPFVGELIELMEEIFSGKRVKGVK